MSVINKTRYIKIDGTKVGVITMLYDKGHFGIGVSLCNTKIDKFDKDEGKLLAYNRAVDCLDKNPLLLKDIGNLSLSKIETIGGFKFPRNTYEADMKVCIFLEAYCLLVDDMVYTLALSKVRAETE